MSIRTGGRAVAAIGIAVAVACKKSPAPSDDDTTGAGTTMLDPSTTTTTTGTTTADDVVDPTNDTNPDGTGCCEIHDGIGCDEAAVQACVCDESPECCTFGWDDLCVDRALACDATCMPDPDPTTMTTDPSDTSQTDPETGPSDDSTGNPGGNDGPCCEAVQSGTGCGDADITACTCDVDPYCCEEFWDEYCVAEASQYCPIDCGNDCCMAHDATACNDAEVFGCVIEQMESCYDSWSQSCVDTAQAQCGLACG